MSKFRFRITEILKCFLCSWSLIERKMCFRGSLVCGAVYSIAYECLSAHIVRIDTCQASGIPDNIVLRPLNFSFPMLIYFFSFWLPLSPRQFSHRNTAESARLFHMEEECWKASLATCQISEYCKSLPSPNHLLLTFLLFISAELNYAGYI